ncbi:MAG: polyprenyl synthetase family protein [Anaerolineae bacterium]
MSLQKALDRFLPLIEAELQEVVQTSYRSLEPYYGMMRYHLGWTDENLRPVRASGGKRLRPVLCLLCCEAAGGDPWQALPIAAALELVHNFSLVHDDIQDGSRYRRGRRTVWDVWGVAHGINVGDGLFVLARLALDRMVGRDIPPARCQAATWIFDRACLALCEGQFFDMAFEDCPNVDLNQYLDMIQRKTANLFAASTSLGAMVATDDRKLLEGYSRFGEYLGMAFQIQDDILGIWGDERVTGKSAAIDVRDRKKTLPVVYALNHAEQRDWAQQLAKLYARPGPLDETSIRAVLDILDRLDARQYTEEMAEQYYQQALQSLEQVPMAYEAQSQLYELAASLVGRKT